jgi:2,4'-dihydroxyacetophenone dioxygenase
MASALGKGDATHPRREPKGHIIRADGTALVRVKDIPWTPWAMDGTEFKLLRVDDDNALMVIVLRIAPNLPAPPHHHLGSAEAFILEGCFSYDYGTIHEGDYVFEPGGCTHDPTTHDEGCTMVAIVKGGLQGTDASGKPAGPVLDINWHVETARANGAAGHLVRKTSPIAR